MKYNSLIDQTPNRDSEELNYFNQMRGSENIRDDEIKERKTANRYQDILQKVNQCKNMKSIQNCNQ